MKKVMSALSILLVFFSLSACSMGPVAPPVWNYEKEAVMLRILSDPQLNLYSGTAHTLHLCVYQLKDPNQFNQLAGDEQGLYTLLECGLFDESVSTSKRLIIQPGKDLNFTLDRADSAKYIGIAAGYNTLEGKRMTKLYDIPVVEKKKGFFIRKRFQTPDHLNIELSLGPQQINITGN